MMNECPGTKKGWWRLPSGGLTEVWTDGRHVRRPLRSWSGAVHQLLERLSERGLEHVPRFIGLSGDVEVLTFLAGDPVKRPWPEAVLAPAWITQVGRWLRAFHDATRGFTLRTRTAFAWGPAEGALVCHGDLGPWNLLVRDGQFAGVIDWDLARFGTEMEDLVEAAVELSPLRTNLGMASEARLTRRLIQERLDALCGAYGRFSPDEIIRHVPDVLAMRLTEMRSLSALGHEPFVSLVEQGVDEAIARDIAYIRSTF